MITNSWIRMGIDYILAHLDEDLVVEMVARHCHVSQYHFNRLFKAETGESVYAFIKRARMEQSAVQLKTEQERSITEIGMDYGYSASNYSTAFRAHHQLSPAQFRRGANSYRIPHPFSPEIAAEFQTFGDYNRAVRIADLKDMVVIHERFVGNYNAIGIQWREFAEKNARYVTDGTRWIERSFNDPTITGLDRCLYDLCLTVEHRDVSSDTTVIAGGQYAVMRFCGPVAACFTAYQGLFRVWLPQSGYVLREWHALGIYLEMDEAARQVSMDICIPIK